MPSLCEICGKYLCDHTAKERGLTEKQMDEALDNPITTEELDAWGTKDPVIKLSVARKAALNRYGPNHKLPSPDPDIV